MYLYKYIIISETSSTLPAAGRLVRKDRIIAQDKKPGTSRRTAAKRDPEEAAGEAPKIKTKGAITMLEAKIREYREMKRLAEEAQAAAESLADEIKAAMNEAGESKMIVGEYKLSYTETKRETLNKKRLEADLGDLTDYTKITYYKRFAVA